MVANARLLLSLQKAFLPIAYFQAARYGLTWVGLAPTDRASFAWRLHNVLDATFVHCTRGPVTRHTRIPEVVSDEQRSGLVDHNADRSSVRLAAAVVLQEAGDDIDRRAGTA
jgi:hypothetical protein